MSASKTFRGNADNDLEHPVDAAGRCRWRAAIDERSIELRAEGDPVGFRGHAAVFNKPTLIGGKRWGFWEQISVGAFTKTIRENDIRFLVNHDPNFLLARNKAGNLRLSEDPAGLLVDADMVPTTWARDLALLLDRPTDQAVRSTIDQMSFAFEPISWTRSVAADDLPMITVTEVRLWDVSVVTYPAYESTDAGLRGDAFEALAQELGLEPAALLRSFTNDSNFGEATTELRTFASRPQGTGEIPSEPSSDTRDDSQPAETTGITATRQLRQRTLALRHQTLEV